MKQFNTGNEDLNKWLDFYHNTTKSTTKFIHLLKILDKSFLTTGPPMDIEDEMNDYLPEFGLLDLDFRAIAFKDEIIDLEIYNRIVIAILNNVNLDKFKERYAEEFRDMIDKILIEGNYEIYNVEFSSVISILFQKKIVDRSELMAISLLRGMAIGKRYESKREQNQFKKLIFKNKLKKILHI